MKTNLKSKFSFGVGVILVASSAQLSASDYRFWREQVPLADNEYRSVVHTGGERGSWFFKEIVRNHLGQAQMTRVGEPSDVKTSVSSGSNNWFIRAIAPHNHSGGTNNSGGDTAQGMFAQNR